MPQGMVQQYEYEREQRIGFSLERIAKEIGRSGFGRPAIAGALEEHRTVAARGKARTGKSRRRTAAPSAK